MKTLFCLIAAAIVTLVPAAASADETHADCEDDQPWIGYRTTEPLRQAVAALALPAQVDACEGEQWDGQDSVAPGWTGDDAAPPSCYAYALDADRPRFSLCMDDDPNQQPANLFAVDPLHARGAADGTEAYAAADAPFAAMGAAYVGFCVAGGEGLEGAAACEGQAQARAGLYARDNTFENLLVRLVQSPSVTPVYVTESDCDQQTYEEAAMTGDRHRCVRDNTAFGVQLVLP